MSVPHISRRRVLLGAGAAGIAATGLASSANAARPLASPTLMTGYVEVNNYSVGNVAKYELAGGGNVFDIGLIFAANINYDGQRAYLYNNPQVQAQLDAADVHIRPAQAKGIKILLSVLGNHQGAGFANSPDRAAAEAFADQLADVVNGCGLDGIDLDDEWSNYGANGTGQPNDFSFVYLLQALRERLPDKLITLYFIGPTSERLSYGGVNAGDLLDYAWNPLLRHLGCPRRARPRQAFAGACGHQHPGHLLLDRRQPRLPHRLPELRRLQHLQPRRRRRERLPLHRHPQPVRQSDRLHRLTWASVSSKVGGSALPRSWPPTLLGGSSRLSPESRTAFGRRLRRPLRGP